jgi:hypothetical protein
MGSEEGIQGHVQRQRLEAIMKQIPLIVVDMQNKFTGVDQPWLIRNVVKHVKAARKSNVPVVLVEMCAFGPTKLEVERVYGGNGLIIEDPDGIMDRPIMDNDSPKGTKVKFAYENAGTNWDIENVKKYLTLGDIYTVAFTEVHSWHTKVFLKEFRGIEFNSVQFAPVKED